MTIDDAIDNLQRAKARGVKSVILAYWTADTFDCPDDENWQTDAEIVENKFDWSATHSDLMSCRDLYGT